MNKYIALVCLLVAGIALLQETEARRWGWRGGFGRHWYRPFYRPFYRPYYRPYYVYQPYYYPYYYYKRAIEGETTVSKPESSSVNRPATRVLCDYYNQTSILSCTSRNYLIECETFSNIQEPKFEFFGIGKQVLDLETSSPRYWLYPRTINNKKWLNHTLFINDAFRNYSLYFSNTTLGYGFRISDRSCFNDLMELIGSTDYEHTIVLDENAEYRFKYEKIVNVGDILVQ